MHVERMVALRTTRSRGGRAAGRAPGRGRAGRRRRRDVHEGRRADPAAELPELPPPELGRADVAPHLRRSAALGAQHQAAHRSPEPYGGHAALVHREGRRHPGLQGRHLAQRGGDPDDCRLGRQRRAARQPGRPAAAPRLPGRRPVGHRRAGPDRRHPVDHHGRRGAGLVGRARAGADRADRGPLRRVAADQGDQRRHGRPGRPVHIPSRHLGHGGRRRPSVQFRRLARPRGRAQRGPLPSTRWRDAC